MKHLKTLIACLFSILCLLNATGQLRQETVILDEPGFPFIFELNPGESQSITRSYKGKTLKRVITLNSVKTLLEPNYWFNDSLIIQNYYQADVELNISGKQVTLHHRPYQMPEVSDGLRIYIENIKEWDEHGKLGRTGAMKKQVRIAVCMENEPWGPETILFPINNYLWRAAVYNNTWSGLVPFNLLYYHRGEDYGVIPDRLDVVSSIGGKIISTPVPDGAKGSNGVSIESPDGIIFRYAHMNFETIVKYPVGTEVKAGTVLGKTGMTWNGQKNQIYDPHLHVGLKLKGIRGVASFPYLMEAYLRKYPDQVLAIAGGYRFATIGKPVELDAGRSITRDNLPIKSFIWKLSNGETIQAPKTTIIYNQPGLYSEELIVESGEGYQDRDFLYVRVCDPERGKNIASGWAYYYPVRGIKPGMEILFWNRLKKTTSDVNINFGDNSLWYKISKETTHKYEKAGHYVVTLKSTGPENEPATLKMEVIVEN